MQEWLTRDLVEILSGFNASELSAVELMQATLGRIDETRDTLNAFTAVRGDSALLEEAEAAASRTCHEKVVIDARAEAITGDM